MILTLRRAHLAALFLCSITAVAAPPVIRNHHLTRVGESPYALHVGDFAGDAAADLLVATVAGATVLPANGNPFAPGITTTWDQFARLSAIGDFNGDGELDHVYTPTEPFGFAVRLGSGNGAFTGGARIAISQEATAIATGDVDGDGKLDLVLGEGTWDQTSVLTIHRGNGTGAFAAPTTISLGSTRLLAVVSSDLNADGKLDLVLALNTETRVLLGDGTGAFAQAYTTNKGQPAVADFNGDGRRDLLIMRGPDLGIDVQLGNGNGTFASFAVIGEPAGQLPPVIVDFDGDGKLDLVSGSREGFVSLWRGGGNGSFAAPELFLTERVLDFGVADFDRDGALDVVLVTTREFEDRPIPQAVSFIRGLARGRLDAYRVAWSWPGPLHHRRRAAFAAAADLNHDEKPDIVAQLGDRTAVFLNDGTGNLVPTPTGSALPAGSFAVGDVNGDTHQDISVAVLHSHYEFSVQTFFGDGLGTFHAPAVHPLGSAFGEPWLVDYDGDRTLDLIVANDWRAYLYRGVGNGTFVSQGAVEGVALKAAMDVDGDGNLDLLSNTSTTLNVWRGNGSGGFHPTPSIAIADSLGWGGAADFNGDAKLDVLIRTRSGTRVYFGRGDATFSGSADFSIDQQLAATHQAVADFDGDGHVDFFHGGYFLLGNGDGTFRSFAQLPAQWPYLAASVADFDGNGTRDLALTSSHNGTVAVVRTALGAEAPLTPAFSLTRDVQSSGYAEKVTFTGTVSEHAATAATGAIVFSAGGTPFAMRIFGRQPAGAQEKAFTVGLHHVTATYSGDTFYRPATASLQHEVTRARTSIKAASPNSSPQGKEAIIDVFFSYPVAAPLPRPTGTITFSEGNSPVASRVTEYGTWFLGPGLAVGTHIITATYAGDANYEPSSTTFEHVVTKPLPTLYVFIEPSENVMAGETVTLRATISGGATGTITFVVDQKPLSPRPISDGVAEMTTTLPWGHHTVAATYSGDAHWAARRSNNAAGIDVLIGNWGTPLAIDASSGFGTSSVNIRWPRVAGGKTYTVYRKRSHAAAWEVVGVYEAHVLGLSHSMPIGATWMYAVTATDANGNTTPMSTPDLATSVLLPLITTGKRIDAVDVAQLRTGINAVRTFAGMQPFAFSGDVAKGAVIRKDHVIELRGALSEARAAIGLPLGFSDPTLTAKPVRAIHMREIRAGID